MYYNPHKAPSSYSTAFFVLLTAISVAAGAVIVFEAIKLQRFHASVGSTTAFTFGLMLASLAGVLLSVILPERIGKAILLLGALGFFACLAVALVFGFRV
ncbi:MAG: hypothetical protein ACKVQT_17500 [Burkholderiales bacterium]